MLLLLLLLLLLQKRVLIGGLVTLGLGAFALVPTEALRLKPSKPMYFYVVPLLRIKASTAAGSVFVFNSPSRNGFRQRAKAQGAFCGFA